MTASKSPNGSATAASSVHGVVDEQNCNEGTQNDPPIGNLNARYRCFLAKPFHDFLSYTVAINHCIAYYDRRFVMCTIFTCRRAGPRAGARSAPHFLMADQVRCARWFAGKGKSVSVPQPYTRRHLRTHPLLYFIGVNHSKGHPITIVCSLEFSDQPTKPLCKLIAYRAYFSR